MIKSKHNVKASRHMDQLLLSFYDTQVRLRQGQIFKANAEPSGNFFEYEIAILVRKLWPSVWFFLLHTPIRAKENIQSFLDKCLLFTSHGAY
jgi:hypothetical protein